MARYPCLWDPHEGSVRGVVLGWPAGARAHEGGTGNRATGVQGWGLDGVPSAQRLCGFSLNFLTLG